jgi:predicted phage terminase large subunit-like protein
MKNKILSDVSRFRREQASKSILAFAEIYLKHHMKYEPSAAHRKIFDLLFSFLTNRGQKYALAAPRKFGKSSLISLFYILFSVCYEKESYIIVVSNVASQAIDVLNNIKKELLENEKLIMDFLGLLGVVGKFKLRWQKDTIEFRKTKILALGVGQRIRGRKSGADRPSLIIADDLESLENTLTPESREKIKNVFEKSILFSGDETTNYLLLGNLYHPHCLLGEYISKDKHQGWIKDVYSAIETQPKNMQLWMKWSDIYNNREDFEGITGPAGARLYYERNKTAMDEAAVLLWPQRYNLYDLMKMWAENEFSFLSEMQNLPINPKECPFDIDIFHEFNNQHKSVDGLLKSLAEGLQIFAACDPSTGKGQDSSAIVILATNNKRPKTYYVIEADIRNRTVIELVNDILDWHERYNFTDFAIEVNNFQQVMVELLETKAAERGLRIPITPYTNKDSKKPRLYLLHPPVKNGTIQFNKNLINLYTEFRYFPKGHDDGMDALEMAFRLAEQYTNTSFEDYENERKKEKRDRQNKPDSERKITGINDDNGNEINFGDEDIGWLFNDYEL